jgi:hypothetical protein
VLGSYGFDSSTRRYMPPMKCTAALSDTDINLECTSVAGSIEGTIDLNERKSSCRRH